MYKKVTQLLISHKNIASSLFLISLVVIFFLNIFVPHLSIFVHPDYGQSDIWQQTYASKYFLAQGLKQHQIPLWNPYIGNGYPEFAKAEMGTFNIFNLVFLSQLPFPLAINMIYLSLFIVLILSTYLYCRLIKLSVLASLFVAVIFCFSSFFTTKFPHLSRIQTISFMPVLLSLVVLMFKKHRIIYALFFSVIFAQQFFSGHAQMIFITCILVAAQTLYLFLAQKKDIKGLMLVGFAGVIYVPLIAVQLFPTLELLQKSARGSGFSPQLATFFSYSWSSLATMVNPMIFGSPHNGTYPSLQFYNGNMFWENTSYLGILALLFIGFGIYHQKNKLIRFYTVLALIALLFMTGKYSPLYFIHSIQPFSFFRAPAKYIVIFLWCLAVIAGFGFNHVRTLLLKKYSWLTVTFFGLLVIMISFVDLYRFYHVYTPVDDPKNWITSIQEAHKPTPSLDHDYRYIVLGTEDEWNDSFIPTGWQDLRPYRSLLLFNKPNVNTFTKQYSSQMYNILLVNRFEKMNSILFNNIIEQTDTINITPIGHRLLDLNSVRYIVSTKPISSEQFRLMSKRRVGKYLMYVYESGSSDGKSTTLPRLHFAREGKKIETVQDFVKQISTSTYNPDNITLTEDHSIVPGDKKGIIGGRDTDTASIIYDSGNQILVHASSNNNQLLVLTDTYYPGWNAYIDGVRTKVFPVNLNQRAIQTPSGSHEILFSYEPDSYYRGKIMSLMSHVLIMLLMVISPLASRLKTRFFASSR